MQTFQELTAPIRQNPKAWALCGFGLLMPFVCQIGDRIFGGPYGDRSWFTPVSTVLFVLGFVCCVAAPFFVPDPFLRRLKLAAFAVLGYVGAIFGSMIVLYFTFGPYKDWERRWDDLPTNTTSPSITAPNR